MKKAKEYAREFIDNPTEKTLHAIIGSFFVEMKELMEQRQVSTKSGMASIFDEQDRKWRAFARRIDGIKSNGLSDLIENEFPDAYQIWKPR